MIQQAMDAKDDERDPRAVSGTRRGNGSPGPGRRLATELARLRLARGLTQEQLARRLQTKQECIARLESGRSLPSLSTVSRLATALGAELEIRLLPKSQDAAVSVPVPPCGEMSRTPPPNRAGLTEVMRSGNSNKAALLRKSPIFADLDERYLTGLSRLAVEQPLKAGQFLFREGEPAESCYLVISGLFKVVTHSPSGMDFITAIYGQGEMLGNANLFAIKPRRSSAQAIVDSKVLSIVNGHLLAFLRENPALSAQLLEKMLTIASRRRQAAISRLRELASERTDRRLARILLTLCLGLGPCIPLTRREIAEMTGTTAETAARFISRLARTGIVQSLRGKIIVMDQSRLRQLAETW